MISRAHQPSGARCSRGRRARAAARAAGREAIEPGCGSTSSARRRARPPPRRRRAAPPYPSRGTRRRSPSARRRCPRSRARQCRSVATSTPSRGEATSVSAPFSSTTAAEARRGAAHRVEPVRVDLVGARRRAGARARRCAASAPSAPRARTARAPRARRRRARPAARAARAGRARARPCPSLRPSPGPIATASAFSAASRIGVGGARQQPARASPRAAAASPPRAGASRAPAASTRARRPRRSRRRRGTRRARRASARRSGRASRRRRAPTRREYFVDSRVLARHLEQRRRGDERVLVLARTQPDRRDVHGPRGSGPARSRARPWPRRTSRSRPPGPPRPAPRRSTRSRRTGRRPRRPGAPLAFISSIIRAASSRGASAKADPEQRVDDHVRLARGRRRPRRRARRARARAAPARRPGRRRRSLPPPQTTVTRPGKLAQHDARRPRARRAPSAPPAAPGARLLGAPRLLAVSSGSQPHAVDHDRDRGRQLARVRHRELDPPGADLLGPRGGAAGEIHAGLRPAATSISFQVK